MRYLNGQLHIGDLPAAELIERYGSPLYVYDRAVLDRQIARLSRAFEGLPIQLAYALKANANVHLLRHIASAGVNFDAVSPGEIFLLRKAGVAGDRIWFTCSNVSDGDLRAIDDPSIVINLNSMSELDRVVAAALPNPIALRVNPDVGAGHHKDVVTGGFGVKFGFDLAEIEDALTIADINGIRVTGVHAHIGSGVTDTAPLIQAAKTIIGVGETIPTLEWVNFGGGFATPYKPEDQDFPIDDFGRELREVTASFLDRRRLRAIVEPGRYLVAECGTLLTTVTALRVSSGFTWLGCDTGFNHLARPSKYGAYHHIINASRGSDDDLRWSYRSTRPADTVVAGNICESGDVFTRGDEGIAPRDVPPAHVGEILAICDAGAYGFSMASHYNARLLPPEVFVEGGTARLIRKRQSYEELLMGQSE